MKKLLFLTVTFFITLSCLWAQKTETIKVSGEEYPAFIANAQYKYPAYKKAKIVFKNGDIASARLNYDYFNQTMKYIGEKGDTLIIANEEDLHHISIGTDSFFYDNGYYEWIASSATARLAVKRVYKEGPRVLVGAFGTTSPAKNIESHTKILTEHADSKELSQNEVVTISKETTYYISPINDTKNNFVTATRSNINRLFPKKNVEDFIKDNRLNLNKEEDLIDLMVYISKPK